MGSDLKDCPEVIRLRMVWHLWHCDPDYGRRVAEIAGVDLAQARALPPLPGKPAPGAPGGQPTYTSGEPEEPAGGEGQARDTAPAK
ncbi:MAG TPA: catalase-related domain-containing protein [Ramlibacter sp.]|nr:catalase-related domain-containing protein [Ramlibacter sp.]